MDWINLHGGIWDFFSLVILVAGIIGGIKYLRSKRYIPNLNIKFIAESFVGNFPLRVTINILNRTNIPVVLSNFYFVPNELKADCQASGDSGAKYYPLNFPGNDPSICTEKDCFLRDNTSTSTFFPVSSISQTKTDIEVALKMNKAGYIIGEVYWIESKPRKIKVKIEAK